MIGALIGIIVLIIILGVVYWAINQLLPLIPLPEPFRRMVYVLMVVVMVLIVVVRDLELLGVAGVRRRTGSGDHGDHQARPCSSTSDTDCDLRRAGTGNDRQGSRG